MGWEPLGKKLIYKFDNLAGWTPSAGSIMAVAGSLFNCKNVRFEEGKVRSRGGWKQFTTGDSGLAGLFGFIDGSGSHLVSTEGGALREYDTGTSAWVDRFTLLGNSQFGKSCFMTAPTADGTSGLVVCDKVNDNLRYDLTDKPFEIGSMKIASMDEEWTGDRVDEEYTVFNSGSQALRLYAQDAEETTALYNFGGGGDVWIKATPDQVDTDCYVGDISGLEMQVATRITLNGTFDTVEFYYDPVNTPDAASFFVRVETDDGDEPSGTLVGCWSCFIGFKN